MFRQKHSNVVLRQKERQIEIDVVQKVYAKHDAQTKSTNIMFADWVSREVKLFSSSLGTRVTLEEVKRGRLPSEGSWYRMLSGPFPEIA